MATLTTDELRREPTFSLLYDLQAAWRLESHYEELLAESVAKSRSIAQEIKRRIRASGCHRVEFDGHIVEIGGDGELVLTKIGRYGDLDKARDPDPADLVDLTLDRPDVAEAVTAGAEEGGAAC